jgi:hypothetical protein
MLKKIYRYKTRFPRKVLKAKTGLNCEMKSFTTLILDHRLIEFKTR